MAKTDDDEKVKVSFSISLTKTYTLEDITAYIELSDVENNNLEDTLRQMICEDVLDAMRDGKGSFKIH